MKINLRNYYPFYMNDCFIDVEEIIAATLQSMELFEKAYRKRMNRHKAYYSLNFKDGIEREKIFLAQSPSEIYEKKVTKQALYTAMNQLTEKQAKRIYAHFILGLSKVDIAKAEGVSEYTVRDSIKRGLKNLKKNIDNFQ